LKLKLSPLETECGGEWRKWLKRWVSRCPRVLTPWPGWPACRLILGRFSPENCLSPYAVRVTMDTVLLPGLWVVERQPGWWRGSACRNTRRTFAENFLSSTTHSTDCTAWPRVLAGSIGKTTTKEILAALVGARFCVLKTQGNLNNEYGLPLTLLGLSDEYDAAIIEMGMSHRGELARLAQIARPDVGVITRVAVEHLEFFASVDEIALAERELIENLAWPSATAVLNADDERVARFSEVARGPVVWFGASPRAEFRAEKIEERGVEGSAFDFVSPTGRARLELPLIGRHNVMNAVAALAAASVWGIGADDARRVFPSLVPADKRGEVVRFEDGFTVINDSYNSSPTALDALAELLAATPGYRRRILAAGEMLELGASAPELHRECGSHAAALAKIDWIFGVRGNAAELVQAAIEAGHPKERARFFENSGEAAQFISGFIERGDLLLLKGSRGVRMEKILEAIEAGHKRSASKSRGERVESGQRVKG
jgi:UDP-N-acetylmuramoyl-tripeptide--D-alanyl-D-alanine ligase